MKTNSLLKTWIASILFLVISLTAHAGNVNWLGVVNGKWSDGTKWSGGSAPTLNDTAVITIAGTYTVTMNGTASIAKLLLGNASGIQTLSMNGNILTIANNSAINPHGVLDFFNSSTLNGAGTLTNSGRIILNGSNTIAANLICTDTIFVDHQSNSITGTFTTTSTSVLYFRCANYVGQVTFSNGWTNNGKIMLAGTYYYSNLVVTAGVLVNPVGSIIQSTQNVYLYNRIDAAVNNQGTTNVDGTLHIYTSVAASANTGAITYITAGSTLNYHDGIINWNGGTINFNTNGLLAFNNATLNWNSGTITGMSKMIFTGSTANFNVQIIPAVNIEMNSSTLASSFLPITSAHKITMIYGNTISAALFNTDTMIVQQYSNVMTGALTTSPSSVISIDGASYTADFVVSSGFTNNGLIEIKSLVGYNTSLGVTTGNLINAGGGIIRSYGPSAGSRALNAALTNQGALIVDYSLTISTSGTSSNIGVITIAPLQILTFNGGKLDFNSGSVSGTGTLYFNSCNYSVNVSNIPTVFTQFYSSKLSSSLSQINNLSTLEFIYWNTISANLKNKSTGIINVSQYANIVSGNYTNEAGSLLAVNGATYTADITFNNGFTNNGTIDIKSLVGYNTALYVTAGEILNLGTIHSYGPSAGSRTLGASLNNQGALTIDYSLLISKAGALHTNTGSVSIASLQQLTFDQGSLRWNGGTANGTGTLYFSNCIDSVNVPNIPGVFTQFYSSQLNSSLAQINNSGTIEFIYGNTMYCGWKQCYSEI